jgi:small ligand-binding sensory domain FIST
MRVASALRKGRSPSPELAAQAVEEAMAKAGLSVAQNVLLFLTSDFARDAERAVRAAARAANCMQVTGCTALGVLTETDWILDAPAAATLVLGDSSNPLPTRAIEDDWLLTLTAPNAIETAWLHDRARRFGAVSGDATGQGPYKVWTGSRVLVDDRAELAFPGKHLRVAVSQGLAPLSEPRLARVDGTEVISVGDMPALAHLARYLPADLPDEAVFPLHRLMAGITWGTPETAIAEGRYHVSPLLSVNLDARSVSLAWPLEDQVQLFWAIRDPRAAELDMLRTIEALDDGSRPSFGICFPCLGRGPSFYDGTDKDTAAIIRHYPDMPLVGFYGNGEIVNHNAANQLMQYSTVLALYTA